MFIKYDIDYTARDEYEAIIIIIDSDFTQKECITCDVSIYIIRSFIHIYESRNKNVISNLTLLALYLINEERFSAGYILNKIENAYYRNAVSKYLLLK